MIGISHEGGSVATIRAMDSATARGARVGVITGSAGSPAARAAAPELVVETVEMDQSWCHTIGYISPLLAAAAIGAELSGIDVDPAVVRDLLADGSADEVGAEAIASEAGRWTLDGIVGAIDTCREARAALAVNVTPRLTIEIVAGRLALGVG